LDEIWDHPPGLIDESRDPLRNTADHALCDPGVETSRGHARRELAEDILAEYVY
jgi:hypothetical protein